MPSIEDRLLPEILPDEVKDFISSEIIVGDMALPSRYPKPIEMEAWQVGFRFHGLTGESLVSTTSGAWQPGWYVIAMNGFDDPFFIDINESPSGFPVYYAPHGAGRWDATVAARNIRRFSQLLSALHTLADDDAKVLTFIEAETDTSNALWREVHEARANRETLEHELAQTETEFDLKDLEHGTLFITAVGPQKLKIAQVLRRALDLSLGEALASAAEPEIPIGSAPFVQLRRLQNELIALGALVEFRPDAEPLA
ncbi:hypothetical protein [Rhizobium leguminosarum]